MVSGFKLLFLSISDSTSSLSHSELLLLVQRGHSLSSLDLIQAEGESEAAGQLLDAAHVRRCPVQVWTLILQQLVEQLTHTHTGEVHR